MSKKVIGREAKFVQHIEKSAFRGINEDTHIIKEVIHYDDGTKERKMRMLKNYVRPYWITIEGEQNHSDKKEYEDSKKVIEYESTQSDLILNASSKLGYKYRGNTSRRKLVDSTYVYGIDVNSSVYIKKKEYLDKYPDIHSELNIGVIDIETDIAKNIISIGTVVTDKYVHVFVTKVFLEGNNGLTDKAKEMYMKNIPDERLKDIEINIHIVEDELELVKKLWKQMHSDINVDIYAIWNITFEMSHFDRVIKVYNLNPSDIYCNQGVPSVYRNYSHTPPRTIKKKANGETSPIAPIDQWPVYETVATFQLVCAMRLYKKIRMGAAAMEGGYGLDNVLKTEGLPGKLKLDNDITLVKASWHNYMSKNMKAEYIAYNIYDCLGMILLDKKTKDIELTLEQFSGATEYSIFIHLVKKYLMTNTFITYYITRYLV